MRRLLLFCGVCACAIFGAGAQQARAVPILQLYIEGATYDSTSETWVLVGGGSFKLWVVGDVDQKGAISGVKLSAAVATSEIGGGSSIGLTPTTTSLLTDPSTPGAPTATANFPSADGAVPKQGDGSDLPTHGIFGAGTSFFEWMIGDFTLTDSPIGDFSTSFPGTFPDNGQINAYDVSVTGFTRVHFDAYDHVTVGGGRGVHSQFVFAPFSHDAEFATPEPASAAMLVTGLVGLVGYRWRRRQAAA